jgi:hypothetical protein
MSTIRFGRDREYRFFRREDIRARWDESSAIAFLNRFRTDSLAMAGFRRQISGSAAGKLSDEDVIKRIARMLVSGELVVVRPQLERVKDELPPTPPEAPPPPERQEPAPVEVPEDEPTFAPDNHGELQAAVLITAAQTGVAFCEECQRLAEEEQKKKEPPKPVAKTAPPVERRAPELKSGPTFPPNHDAEAQAEVLIAAAKEGIPFCEECARMAAEEEAKTK